MEATSNCIPFTPRHAKAMRDEFRHTVYLETLAECIYETAMLCDRLEDRPPSWDSLPASMKYRYRCMAEDNINKVSEERQS